MPTKTQAEEIMLRQVLRVNPANCQHLDDEQVDALLTGSPLDYFNHVWQALIAIADGESSVEIPPKQVFIDPDNTGDFRVMPCVVRHRNGVLKTVKIVGTNIQQTVLRDQITVGMAFALHAADNFITHSFDACLLSSVRTGLCAALAIEQLSSERQSVAINGAGRVGYYAAVFISQLAGVKNIILCDKAPNQAADTGRLLNQEQGLAVTIADVETLPDQDVLVLATDSTIPVYQASDFAAKTVISLGADTLWQRELDERLIDDSEIYVDTIDSLNYGDLCAWVKKGIINSSDVIPLFPDHYTRDTIPNQNRTRRLFISTGSALLDNLTIGYILAQQE